MMNLNDFDFELPEHLIAQTPLKNRTASKMLVLHRTTGDYEHKQFVDLKDYVQPGDLLILNDTKVLPARLFGVKSTTGANVEILLLQELQDLQWKVLAKPAKKLKTGTEIIFSDELRATVIAEHEMGERTLQFTCNGIFLEILEKLGEMPLPPYIREKLSDQDRYQTVYAREQGSAAAPTAGLHFTEEYLDNLRAKGVQIGFVTLHVGLGTFRPVMVEDIQDHQMHSEYYVISPETAQLMADTRAHDKKIIAIGTTSARTLETAAQHSDFTNQGFQACSGWTNIFIYPGYTFKGIDGLFTNFHLPKSTLMMMISAFAGREQVMKAYQSAIENEYRFFSFGDAMLLID
jgi:S-adenosylmethionine:tRNA ribosyltransferase-isomerase